MRPRRSWAARRSTDERRIVDPDVARAELAERLTSPAPHIPAATHAATYGGGADPIRGGADLRRLEEFIVDVVREIIRRSRPKSEVPSPVPECSVRACSRPRSDRSPIIVRPDLDR